MISAGKIMPTLEGEWAADKEYPILGIVAYGNGSYMSKKKIRSSVPPDEDAEHWQLLVSAGIVEETDPTVPEWAKQKEKPAYTAEEVGAVGNEDIYELTAFDIESAYDGIEV